MNREKLTEKLYFYWGFLDSFIDNGKNTLRENDIQSLKMLREYIIDALSESEKDIILSMLEDTVKDLKGGRSDH